MVAVRYCRWLLKKSPKYSDLAWKLLVFWRTGCGGEVVAYKRVGRNRTVIEISWKDFIHLINAIKLNSSFFIPHKLKIFFWGWICLCVNIVSLVSLLLDFFFSIDNDKTMLPILWNKLFSSRDWTFHVCVKTKQRNFGSRKKQPVFMSKVIYKFRFTSWCKRLT